MVSLHLEICLSCYTRIDIRHLWSYRAHLLGPFTDYTVSLSFCVKKRRESKPPTPWPAGEYCIYHTHPCPFGGFSICLKQQSLNNNNKDFIQRRRSC